MANKKKNLDLNLGETGLEVYKALMADAPKTVIIGMIAQAIAREWEILAQIDTMMKEAEALMPGSSIVDDSREGNGKVAALLNSRKTALSNLAQQEARWRIELNASGAKNGEKAEKKPESKLAALMPSRKTGGV